MKKQIFTLLALCTLIFIGLSDNSHAKVEDNSIVVNDCLTNGGVCVTINPIWLLLDWQDDLHTGDGTPWIPPNGALPPGHQFKLSVLHRGSCNEGEDPLGRYDAWMSYKMRLQVIAPGNVILNSWTFYKTVSCL